MAVDQLTILVITVILFFIIDSYSYILGSFYLGFFFLFASANISPAQGTFYAIALLMYVVFGARFKARFESKEGKVPLVGRLKGLAWQGATIMAGVLIYFMMLQWQGGTQASILGSPQLAATTTLLTSFSPAIVFLLGVIENRFFITVYHWLLRIPFLGGNIIFAVIGTGLLFGLIHIGVYGLSVAGMLFAAIIMSLFWLVPYLFLKDSTHADVSHGLWNANIELGRTLSFI